MGRPGPAGRMPSELRREISILERSRARSLKRDVSEGFADISESGQEKRLGSLRALKG